MSRCLLTLLGGLLVGGLSADLLVAGELQLAKVYRDYPGYLSPPLCDNPRMAGQVGTASQALQGQARPGAGYLGFWSGVTTLHGQDYGSETESFTVEYATGYAAGAVAGWDAGALRLELEGNYRSLGIDKVETWVSRVGSGAELTLQTLMLNLYYDLATGSRVTPYLGVGIGMAWIELDDLGLEGIDRSDDDEVLAGQAGAGFRIPLGSRTDLDIGYRFVFTEDPEFRLGAVKLDTEIASHTVLLGLNLLF